VEKTLIIFWTGLACPKPKGTSVEEEIIYLIKISNLVVDCFLIKRTRIITDHLNKNFLDY